MKDFLWLFTGCPPLDISNHSYVTCSGLEALDLWMIFMKCNVKTGSWWQEGWILGWWFGNPLPYPGMMIWWPPTISWDDDLVTPYNILLQFPWFGDPLPYHGIMIWWPPTIFWDDDLVTPLPYHGMMIWWPPYHILLQFPWFHQWSDQLTLFFNLTSQMTNERHFFWLYQWTHQLKHFYYFNQLRDHLWTSFIDCTGQVVNNWWFQLISLDK